MGGMMKHEQACRIAEGVASILEPECERIAIAGSIRRGKPEVKDIEIVVIPKTRVVKDMFKLPITFSALEQYPWSLIGKLVLDGPRQKKIRLYEGIALDLYIVLPPAQWGVIYTIRTGPADFSQWVVTPRKKGGALPSSSKVSEGRVLEYGKPLAMGEEIDFLNYLGLGWIEPEERRPMWKK